MRNKETDLKLKLLQNRVKNLQKEEIRARWRIQHTVNQGEMYQKLRQQKFEHSQLLSESMKKKEFDQDQNKSRVTTMRAQINESIYKQRNSVFCNNRKLKEDVISKMRTLKKQKRSQDQFQHESDKKKRHEIVNSKTNAKVNKSLEMFAVRAEARRRTYQKVDNNTKTSQGNLNKIKKLEKFETEMMSKLKETYLEHDKILNKYQLNGNYTAMLTSRENSVDAKLSRQNFEETSARISTDLSINPLHGVSLTPLSKYDIFKHLLNCKIDHEHTKTQNRRRHPTKNSLFNIGAIDDKSLE